MLIHRGLGGPTGAITFSSYSRINTLLTLLKLRLDGVQLRASNCALCAYATGLKRPLGDLFGLFLLGSRQIKIVGLWVARFAGLIH